MNKLLFLIFFLCGAMSHSLAQNHFVFIQSENKEAFTVKLNNNSYNANSTGFVIIPKLSPGNYKMDVVYSKTNTPSSQFSFVIDRKDVGFLLKEQQQAVVLTNIQTFVSLSSADKGNLAKNENATGIKSPANASTLEKALSAKNTRKGVSKIFEIEGSVGVSLRYVDVQEISTDTVDIMIPVEKVVLTNEEFATFSKKGQSKSKQSLTKVESGLQLLSVHQEGYRKTCVNLASGEDFYKLRRKMSSETSVEKMISEVKKVGRTKCFTTIQIKNLSPLFETDEDKLKFFDASYPLIYDYIQFSTLEKEFSKTESADKFRASLQK